MPNTPPQMRANGNIRPSRFVKIDITSDDECLEASANCMLIGISQVGSNYPPLSDIVTGTVYAAADGEPIQLYGEGDVCLLVAGDVVTVGDRLKSDAQGRGVPIAAAGTTIQHFGAVALQSAAAAGEHIRVIVTSYRSVRPALV